MSMLVVASHTLLFVWEWTLRDCHTRESSWDYEGRPSQWDYHLYCYLPFPQQCSPDVAGGTLPSPLTPGISFQEECTSGEPEEVGVRHHVAH